MKKNRFWEGWKKKEIRFTCLYWGVKFRRKKLGMGNAWYRPGYRLGTIWAGNSSISGTKNMVKKWGNIQYHSELIPWPPSSLPLWQNERKTREGPSQVLYPGLGPLLNWFKDCTGCNHLCILCLWEVSV